MASVIQKSRLSLSLSTSQATPAREGEGLVTLASQSWLQHAWNLLLKFPAIPIAMTVLYHYNNRYSCSAGHGRSKPSKLSIYVTPYQTFCNSPHGHTHAHTHAHAHAHKHTYTRMHTRTHTHTHTHTHTSTMQKATIEKGHATYEQLQDPTLPVWKSIYFFNLTNPEEFESGEKPNLTEIGPYSYRYVV